jgi:hypothetical protein
MPYPNDLLTQAAYLAVMDKGKPRQANLRRAVSAAYYALFHLLVADAVQRFSPRTPDALALRIGRAFVHSDMKQICVTVFKGHKSIVLGELQPEGFSPELRSVAEAFVDLQTERHSADYDLPNPLTRLQTLDAIDIARKSFHAWAAVRNADEANVFLAAMLFGARWSK